MKNYWNDYVELLKMTGRFYKKHWFGAVVFTVFGIALEVLSAKIYMSNTKIHVPKFIYKISW
jgi:hypothetical protein